MSDEEETPVTSWQAFTEWVEATFALIESDASGQHSTACPEWWKHHEAVWRLKAMHIAYLEAATKNELSSWWVHHWDAHKGALFNPDTGIFRECGYSHQEHTKTIIGSMFKDRSLHGRPIDSDYPCWL